MTIDAEKVCGQVTVLPDEGDGGGGGDGDGDGFPTTAAVVGGAAALGLLAVAAGRR